MSGESSDSGRLSKREASLGTQVAVQERDIGELRRDIDRLEGALGEQRAQIESIQLKAGEALTLASRPVTGAHEVVPDKRKQALAVGGGGVAGGAGLALLIEYLVRTFGGG